MLRALGCDLVGMSTVLEATAARALDMEELGLSLVAERLSVRLPEVGGVFVPGVY